MTSSADSLRHIGDTNPKYVSAMLEHLSPGEAAVAAFHSPRAEYALKTVRYATVLVTNQRLLIGNEPSLGRSRVKIAIDLRSLRASGAGPLSGVGPTWEVAFQTGDGSVGSMYARHPGEAEELAAVVKQAAIALR